MNLKKEGHGGWGDREEKCIKLGFECHVKLFGGGSLKSLIVFFKHYGVRLQLFIKSRFDFAPRFVGSLYSFCHLDF